MSLAEAFGEFQYPTPPLGRVKADMLGVLDQEKGLALAETLTEAGERIAAGERGSGPAADRYRTAAAEFSDRYTGTYLGKRELRALVANPRLQVYEDPKAFLTATTTRSPRCAPRTATGRATAAGAPRPLPLPSRMREHQPHRQPDRGTPRVCSAHAQSTGRRGWRRRTRLPIAVTGESYRCRNEGIGHMSQG